METIFNLFDSYLVFISTVKALSNIAIFYVFYTNVRKLFCKKVKLSCGSFKIKRKHFTAQNVTNVVSLRFYNGGLVPDEIRKEILRVTCPEIKIKK